MKEESLGGKILLGFIICVVILGFIGLIWMATDMLGNRMKICSESNGVTKGIGETKCINETGVYEIVYLNDEWRLIR